jgi:ribosomal protein S18 acetylase RimI-like enzyme
LPNSAVSVAYHNDKPVGFVSGTSFVDNGDHFTQSIELFEKNGLDPKKFYYIEAIVMPEHRKKSLAHQLHDLIIEHAQSLGYESSCFVEESHENHPLKPADYQSRDDSYTKAGYTKTSMIMKFPWRTIQPDGSLKDQEHELRYWIKNLQ